MTRRLSLTSLPDDDLAAVHGGNDVTVTIDATPWARACADLGGRPQVEVSSWRFLFWSGQSTRLTCELDQPVRRPPAERRDPSTEPIS